MTSTPVPSRIGASELVLEYITSSSFRSIGKLNTIGQLPARLCCAELTLAVTQAIVVAFTGAWNAFAI